MLILPDQRPIYLIMDPLDESSNTPGIPPPRKKVLVGLWLDPLISCQVSFHDRDGEWRTRNYCFLRESVECM